MELIIAKQRINCSQNEMQNVSYNSFFTGIDLKYMEHRIFGVKLFHSILNILW